MFKLKRLLGILAAVFLLALNVSAVFAEMPAPVHIVVDEISGDNSPGPFTASGPAVDAGLICASGTVHDVDVSYNDPGSSFVTIWALKRFNCGDGTFDLKMVVRLDLISHDTTARWRIVGGTGNYADLDGQGSLIGYSNFPTGILDVYDGVLH